MTQEPLAFQGVGVENPGVDWHTPVRLQGEPETPGDSKQGGHKENRMFSSTHDPNQTKECC